MLAPYGKALAERWTGSEPRSRTAKAAWTRSNPALSQAGGSPSNHGSIGPPKKVASGHRSNAAAYATSQARSTSTSSSVQTTYSPRASRMAAFLAFDWPGSGS